MRRVLIVLALLLPAGCARMKAPGFPSPVRPPVLVQVQAEQVYASLLAMLEARGLPIVVEDEQFGFLRTDWVYWDEGELAVSTVADCPVSPDAPLGRVRARFGFDIRRRTAQSSVHLLSQWQMEKLAGFEKDDAGFVDCRSTGEWERMVEGTLTQRQTIR
jgi:hypothetical protein